MLDQYRLPPLPTVVGAVAVDGSEPEAVGVAWLPSTAVGDGDERGAYEGDAGDEIVVLAVGDGDAEAGGGDPGGDAEGPLEAAGAVWLTTADGLARVGEADADGLDWVAAGLRASEPVDDAANTTAPSATSARAATSGTRAIPRPSGARVRQFGQKPETGVKTLPQFRHRIGRRSRATACLVAFSMRDRF